VEDLGGAGWGGWSCLDLFLYGYDIHVLRYPTSMHVITYKEKKKRINAAE